jgi:methylthioribulose-1-phosphate dehydratase
VLHTHSVSATVLSRLVNEYVEISGYEMQKALHGNSSHEPEIRVPVFNNTQDIPELADRVAEQFNAGELTQPGLLVRGHGLYAWGRDISEAQRHIEGFEFLFACLMQKERLSRI